MTVYRLVKLEQRARDLSGIGAFYAGGRWNNEGSYAVYCSENQALALLEILVHTDETELPPRLFMMTIEVSDDAPIYTIKDEDLPANWRHPDQLQLKAMGDKLFQENRYIGIKARSAVLPAEYNIILNPLYPDFHRYIKVTQVEPLELDKRLP